MCDRTWMNSLHHEQLLLIILFSPDYCIKILIVCIVLCHSRHVASYDVRYNVNDDLWLILNYRYIVHCDSGGRYKVLNNNRLEETLELVDKYCYKE
jgi:hypothetical protein